MAQTATMTIRIEAEVKDRLDKLSKSTHRSRSFLAAEAVREFVYLNEWQINEIENGLKEADEGSFATEQEVASVFSKWGLNGN